MGISFLKNKKTKYASLPAMDADQFLRSDNNLFQLPVFIFLRMNAT